MNNNGPQYQPIASPPAFISASAQLNDMRLAVIELAEILDDHLDGEDHADQLMGIVARMRAIRL